MNVEPGCIFAKLRKFPCTRLQYYFSVFSDAIDKCSSVRKFQSRM